MVAARLTWLTTAQPRKLLCPEAKPSSGTQVTRMPEQKRQFLGIYYLTKTIFIRNYLTNKSTKTIPTRNCLRNITRDRKTIQLATTLER